MTNFKPRVDETFELGKSLDALIQSAETVKTNRRRSTQVASGNVARTERRVVEIQQTFQVSEGELAGLQIISMTRTRSNLRSLNNETFIQTTTPAVHMNESITSSDVILYT